MCSFLSFLFCQALELKYGVGSEKVGVAAKLVQSTIEKVKLLHRHSFLIIFERNNFQVTKELVGLYDGKILVQALVLEWNFP